MLRVALPVLASIINLYKFRKTQASGRLEKSRAVRKDDVEIRIFPDTPVSAAPRTAL